MEVISLAVSVLLLHLEKGGLAKTLTRESTALRSVLREEHEEYRESLLKISAVSH